MARATTATAMVNDDELEQNWAAEGLEFAGDDDDVVSVGSEDELDDEDAELATAKRVREDGDDADKDDADATMEEDESAPAAKKQKMSEKAAKKARPSKGLHKMTVAEHFKIVNEIYIKHRGGQMTTLELAEGLNESHFVAPAGLGKHTLTSLPLYMRNLLPSWKKDFRGKNKKYDKSPLFLILCSSALRAVELLKHFGSFNCKVGKLFAKHMKVQDQADQIERTFLPIAVGTPARVKSLLEMKALSLEHTRFVIIDMEKDKKSMTVLELNDTAKEMMDMLQFHLLPVLNKSPKLKLVLY